MIRTFAAALATTTCIVALATPAAAQTREYNIPAGSLKSALDAYVRQSGRQIVYRADQVRSARSPGTRGQQSAEAALAAILAGSGFTTRIDGSLVAIVKTGNAPDGERSSSSGGADAGSAAATSESAEIIVTGTNIRGVIPESSPRTVLDRRELDARGATTAEQAVNTFTQNFNSVSGNSTSADRAGFFNTTGVNGVDLRGLGPGTTLVLLNGRRLSGAANGRVVDVSQIPLAAVSRIELLTDSASSVYGSDAVGGVVNFILLDRFQGLDARAGYAMTDDRAQDEYRGSLTGGLNWSTGNAVVSASYLNRSALTADERSFSRGVSGAYTLIQPQERFGLFATLRQEAGDNVIFTADGLFSRRNGLFQLFRDFGLSQDRPNQRLTEYDQANESWFGSLGASWRISNALTIDLIGSYSRVDDGADSQDVMSTVSPPQTLNDNSVSQTWDVTARASGRLFTLPGGDLAYSIGGGVTNEMLAFRRFVSIPSIFTQTVQRDNDRAIRYAFSELNLPLVGAEQEIAGISRFEINLSARYSDYSDFGNDFSPKVGILWAVTPGFNFRGSYGRTFRAPYLNDIGIPGTYTVDDVSGFGLSSPDPAGDRIGLYIDDGVDPNLGPETSTLLAVGVDLRPPSIPRLAISMTYVSIDYTNRIARGDPARGNYYFTPQIFPELYNYAPTRADIANVLVGATPGISNVTGFDVTNIDALVANVGYILDNRLRNIAESRQQAVDFTANYGFRRGEIDYSLGANATYILEAEARTTPSSAITGQSNTLGRPVDFKANAYVGMARGGFTGRLSGNYVGAYSNPFVAASPRIDSWLTFDLTASYDFGGRPGPLGGVTVLLTVQNLMNNNPPFAADIGAGVTDGLSEPIGYDPFNSNPLGRFISIELRKRF